MVRNGTAGLLQLTIALVVSRQRPDESLNLPRSYLTKIDITEKPKTMRIRDASKLCNLPCIGH
jgi:hypothetical protein